MSAHNPAPLHIEQQLLSSLASIDQASHQNNGTDHKESAQIRAERVLAHIAWSRLAEPSDAIAGALLHSVGAVRSLEMVLSSTSPKNIIETVAKVDVSLTRKQAADALARWMPRLNRSETERDIQRALDAGLTVVLPDDDYWPTQLNDLHMHRPIMLWVRGSTESLSQTSMAVVGARAATGYGSHVTAELVSQVAVAGVTIVSGAAYGIDAVAHRSAVAHQRPTVAVLAGGADRAYPQAHDALLQKVAEIGAVCSEMIPGSTPTKWRFLMRNRIIAALTHATIVTEAGTKSGSINTAGHASQLGRPLGAVPGPITSAASAGCHRLIREYSAELITSAGEALQLLRYSEGAETLFDADLNQRLGSWERRVLDALPLVGSRHSETIAEMSGLTHEQTRGILAELELVGLVSCRRRDGESSARWSKQQRK